ncbi:single-stranded DNA-binding protein [bacterium]|nr:single-stranded DNA-binding protein [bacterium]
MASLNKILLIGNVGKDPEIRYVAEGVPVCKFPLATTERYTDKSGNQQERTEWHNIVLWRKTAEIANEYVRKGKQVYIEGKISTNTWTDAENQKHYRTEVVARQLILLGRRDDAPSSAPAAGRTESPAKPRDGNDDELGPPLDDYGDNILNPSG